MRNEFIAHIIDAAIPITVLILFIIFFLSIFFWAMNKKRKKQFDHASKMPLSDGKKSDDNKEDLL